MNQKLYGFLYGTFKEDILEKKHQENIRKSDIENFETTIEMMIFLEENNIKYDRYPNNKPKFGFIDDFGRYKIYHNLDQLKKNREYIIKSFCNY